MVSKRNPMTTVKADHSDINDTMERKLISSEYNKSSFDGGTHNDTEERIYSLHSIRMKFQRLYAKVCKKVFVLIEFLDLSEDGKVNIVDLVGWILILIFCLVFTFSVLLFCNQLRRVIIGRQDLDTMADYTFPLTNVCGTLVTLVFAFSFLDNALDMDSQLSVACVSDNVDYYYTATNQHSEHSDGSASSAHSAPAGATELEEGARRSESTATTTTTTTTRPFSVSSVPPLVLPTAAVPHRFFDFDKDGRIGIVDRVCAWTGCVHATILIVDVLLWIHGSVSTAQVVDLLSNTTRLILLLIAQSYLAYDRRAETVDSDTGDSSRLSGWRFLFDINHDGKFQLVDLLAMNSMVVYMLAVCVCSFNLVIRPRFGHSDVTTLVLFCGQLNFLVIGAFAAVYLTKTQLTDNAERALCTFSGFFLLVLLRTVLEMYLQDTSFAALARLENGMVVGITQLIMGSILVHHRGVIRPRSSNVAGGGIVGRPSSRSVLDKFGYI